MITLSLYPNARGFGYCVVEGKQTFLDYGVATIRPISNEKSMKRIEKLIKRFKPTSIIIQKLEGKYSYKSKRVNDLLQLIKDYAKQKQLALYAYPRTQVRFIFEQYGAKTKYEIAQLLTKQFEELSIFKPYNRRSWECEFHMQSMLDAISLWVVYIYVNHR